MASLARAQSTVSFVRSVRSVQFHLQERKDALGGKCAFDQCVTLLMHASWTSSSPSLGKAKDFENEAAKRAVAPLTELVEAEDKLHALAAVNAAEASAVAEDFAKAADRYAKGCGDSVLK